jgi:hypothetical protein
VDLVSAPADYQYFAQEIHGCDTGGKVWHVAYSGSAGGDGLSWATAKGSPKTIIEGASAGDLVLIGPGTFGISTGITVPDGVRVRGAGKHVTVLTSATATATLVNPGDASDISDLDIVGSLTQPDMQYPIGDAGQAFANAVLRNVYLSAASDGIFLAAGSTLSGHDVEIDSNFDATNISLNSVLELFSPTIRVRGTFSSGGQSRGFVTGTNGTIRCHGGSLDVRQGASAAPTYGAHCVTGAIELFGTRITTEATSGAVYDLIRAGGSLMAVNCQYDHTKTSGTITVVESSILDDILISA